MRALLIVNPYATSTTQLRRDVIVRALSSAVELEVVETRYRGHATRLAAAAADGGFGLVITLGGDGTVNEAVNGILGGAAGGHADIADLARCAAATGQDDHVTHAGEAVTHAGDHPSHAGDHPSHAGDVARSAARAGQAGRLRHAGAAASRPALAALPGGNANVFTRAVGLPPDLVDAAGQILQALAEGRSRCLGVGLAGDRYFTFNAGLGFDAEVVRAVHGRRAGGRAATSSLYIRTAVRQYYQVTDRRHPAIMVEREGHPPAGPVFIAIVSNTSPWTYLGRWPVNPNPRARFESGLDVFAMRRLGTFGTLRTVGHMLSTAGRPPGGRSVLSWHDLTEVTIRSARPVAFQVDGEYVGERECVRFLSVPDALRVIA